MIYPTLTPGNVNRDFVDAFGGYNHNLRIGDNEFYDTENMVSTRYPVLTSRGKRGTVPQEFIPRYHEILCGALYRSALYTVTYYDGYSNYRLHVYKNGTEIAHFTDGVILDNKKRSLIMMGAYLIIFPDKLYVNVEDTTKYGSIEFEETTNNDVITLQPCLQDGKVISINYVGNKEPLDYTDNYVWVDTSVEPPSVKRYSAEKDTWLPVLFQYIRITARDTEISYDLEVGDNVKITGLSSVTNDYDLNGVSIVREKPDDKSIVVSGVFTKENIRTFKPIKEPLRPTSPRESTLRVICDKNVSLDEFKNKYFLIGTERIKCTGNTKAVPYEYWEDRKTSMSSLQADYLTSENSAQVLSTSSYMKFNVVRRDNEGIMWRDGTLDENDPLYVRIGNTISNRNVFRYRHNPDGNNPTENDNQISIQSQNLSVDYLPKKYIGQTPYPYIPANSRIYPIQRGDSKGLYETTLTLNGADVANYENDILCLEPEYTVENTDTVTFSRKMPLMDHVIESNNRLWGCRYGENADGDIVNEIYASKLGDFKNWQTFQGISSDSYIASCGTDGAWTGAINYLSRPVFFKENYIHTVYGAYPAQYNITNVAARGVQEGSSESLAILDEVVYYQSPEGICTYNGSLPVNISAPLGDIRYHNVIGCGYSGKYYAKMVDSSDKSSLMVYDSRRNIWHKENDEDIISLCPVDDNVYYITNSRDLKSFFGAPSAGSPLVKWYFESGMYGLSEIDSKYVTRLNLRLALGRGAHMIVSICYNNSDKWHRLCHVVRKDINPFTLPIKPFRCDHFRLRFEGEGDVMIFSISKTTEQGSDRT